jgi:hypothetical protein
VNPAITSVINAAAKEPCSASTSRGRKAKSIFIAKNRQKPSKKFSKFSFMEYPLEFK